MLKHFGIKKDEPNDREPVQTDMQQIMAYLEELTRLRSLVHLEPHSDPPVCLSARVELVNDQDFTFSLSFPHQVPKMKPGEAVAFHFTLAGMRFRADVAYLDRGRYMESTFRLPDKVHFADRRGNRRTRIGSRENASVAIFESFHEGVACSGKLLNISMEGLCMRMDRAIQVRGGKRLALHQDLFQEGQELQIVRILNLPHLPSIECSGEIRSCAAAQDGPILIGLRLDALSSLDIGNLRHFMARRLPSFAREFPTRRRRGSLEEQAAPEEEDEADVHAALEEGAEEAHAEVIEDPLADFMEASTAEEAGPVDGPAEDRLVRIRRRGKRILVIMPDDLDRSIFICTLHVGGYNCFFEARNLVQGLEVSKKAQIDAIFLDQQIGPLSGTEVAQRLRKMGRMEGVPLFLFMRTPDVKGLLSAKAAGVNHVLKLPVDFDGELKGLLDRALGLIKA